MIDTGVKEKPTLSLADYLEAIIMFREQGERATALSKFSRVKKPRVTWALKKPGEAGLVIHERYSDIKLTPEGYQIAREVYRHHEALFSFNRHLESKSRNCRT